jgi:hypothetical protein
MGCDGSRSIVIIDDDMVDVDNDVEILHHGRTYPLSPFSNLVNKVFFFCYSFSSWSKNVRICREMLDFS